MLRSPPCTGEKRDPRLHCYKIETLNIIQNVRVDCIKYLAQFFRDSGVYSVMGYNCNRDKIFREDRTEPRVPRLVNIPFEEVLNLDPNEPLYDERHNLILQPRGGSRLTYYVNPASAVVLEAIYAHIYQHVLSFSHVNLTTREPDILTHYIGSELQVPDLLDFIEQSSIRLIMAVENIITTDPDRVIQLRQSGEIIYLYKYCDYWTWRYLDEQETRQNLEGEHNAVDHYHRSSDRY